MTPAIRNSQKLLARLRPIGGRVEAIERAFDAEKGDALAEVSRINLG
jgi:DNA-binding FrmR family transcriptional regulator